MDEKGYLRSPETFEKAQWRLVSLVESLEVHDFLEAVVLAILV